MGSTSQQRTSVRPPQDMALVRTHTAHFAGLPLEADGVGGDPSPCTARGVFPSMELAAHRMLHQPLSDCTIAIQGVGHVGAALAQMLHQAGRNCWCPMSTPSRQRAWPSQPAPPSLVPPASSRQGGHIRSLCAGRRDRRSGGGQIAGEGGLWGCQQSAGHYGGRRPSCRARYSLRA